MIQEDGAMIDSVGLWLMVFVALLPDGSVTTTKMDMYGTLDECLMTAEDIVMEAGDPQPWNWEFVCLEYEVTES